MPEARHLLEREVERISPAPFTVEDLLQRRERKERRRRVAAAITALALFGGSVLWLARNAEPDRGEGPVPASQPQVDPDARREFLRGVAAVCRSSSGQRMDRFFPIGTEYSPENIRSIRRLVPLLLDQATSIGALELPPGDEDAAHIVDRFQQMAEKARDARDATRAAPGQFELAARELNFFIGAAYQNVELMGIRACA
jgi:hypothetical protein